MSAQTVPPYPATLDFEAPYEVDRWRPLVQWLLALPHLLIVWALGYASQVVWIITFFAVLFTKRVPDGLHNFQTMYLRYQYRVSTYVGALRETYPPFDFTMSGGDDGADHLRASIEHQDELNRWLPLVKWLLAIPQVIVLVFVTIAAWFVALAGCIAVIVTGRYPEGMRRFLVGVLRWHLRVYAYTYLLVDQYPPFSLQPSGPPPPAAPSAPTAGA